MRWSQQDFTDLAARAASRYESENRWWKWGDPATYVSHAWLLYCRANENSLGMLLLGDAKIRVSRDLLMNFGVASGGGLYDKQELKQAEELMTQRHKLAGPRTGPAVPVVGDGSVLNDQNWTPMLNDAFVLGGAHAGQDFHWAEEGFDRFSMLGEREFLQRRAGVGAAAPQYQAALRRDEAYYKDKWKQYLLGHSNFWAEGIVRVFARELIGLKTFGYSPVFTAQQVSFARDGFSTGTFTDYLNALAAVGFDRMDKTAINAALGEFLFGDSSALKDLGTGVAKPGQHLLKPKTG